MVVLVLSHRTVPAFRESFLLNKDIWITTRVPLYYLDLEVPNKTLFEKHMDNVFPNIEEKDGVLGAFDVCEEQRFYIDDISVCNGRRNSNFFYSSDTATHGKVDFIVITLFLDFLNYLEHEALPLKSGDSAVKFLNFTTLIGYHEWRDRIIIATPVAGEPGEPFDQLLVDFAFNNIYPSILEGLYKKKSEHPLIVEKLWNLFTVTNDSQILLFTRVPDEKHLKWMLDVANRTNFNFWNLRYGRKGLTTNIFLNYIHTKRVNLIQVMLEYGFTPRKMVPSETGEDYFYHPVTFLDPTNKDFMVRFLLACYENCSDLLKLPSFIEVYQKISRMLPLPSQPPTLIAARKIIQAYLHVPSSDPDINAITLMYEGCEIHPSDSTVVTAPQTLRHISRCVIRERLAANYKLPSGIGDLYLPNIIKNYLRLEF